ncbi:MAG: FAD-dependent monooxygenase [Chloroflexi bacterium]|nr:FAD-dependent monooxygenase [Chloroflexota bacterium]
MSKYPHAIVIGGSLAGLMVARVLSEHFAQVTIIERDAVTDRPEARKGQPQARHLHGLLGKGLEIMTRYFPDLPQALQSRGAIIGDMGQVMRWYTNGGYRLQFDSGLNGVLMSRPMLEWTIRERVMRLPNVRVIDECDVKGPIAAPDRSRVIGVNVQHRAEAGREEILSADLVVDASGRGSSSPKWLEALGYVRPPESVIKVDVGYATRVYRRRPEDFDLIGAKLLMVSPDAPHHKRSGFMFPIEDDRWIVTLGGWAGDHAPTDERGFLEYARTLAAPDIYQMLLKLEPLGDIITYKLPSNLRRHYEKLDRFPEGYLVIGDAVCSFNPVYGQGMTSAAMQAAELDRVLSERATLAGLAQRYFKRSARVIDLPWQMTAGEDFRFPETTGPKQPGTDFINAYVSRVNAASHTDPVVGRAFLEVMNLMKPAPSLMRPRILWRVLRAGRATPTRSTVRGAPASQPS